MAGKGKKNKPAAENLNPVQTLTPQKDSAPLIPPKKIKGKVFKCLYSGNYKLSFYNQNAKGETVKVYAVFTNHTCITEDKFLIEKLNAIMETESEIEAKRKTVLTENEFLSITSPEKLYINYKGMNIHIDNVRAGLEVAEENGWEPVEETKLNIGISKSRIVRGGASAGAVKAGF